MLLSNIGGTDMDVLVSTENVKKDCELVKSKLMFEAARTKYWSMLKIDSDHKNKNNLNNSNNKFTEIS